MEIIPHAPTQSFAHRDRFLPVWYSIVQDVMFSSLCRRCAALFLRPSCLLPACRLCRSFPLCQYWSLLPPRRCRWPQTPLSRNCPTSCRHRYAGISPCRPAAHTRCNVMAARSCSPTASTHIPFLLRALPSNCKWSAG